MSFHESIKQNGSIVISFSDIYGCGWDEEISDVLRNKLYTDSISKKINKVGWYSGDIEVYFEKNGMEAMIHFDEFDFIIMYSKSDNCTIEWMRFVAEMIEKYVIKTQNKSNH